jgi:uncharacterized membrane protein
MTVLIGSTALSVDLGKLVAERRTLQAVADMTALDAARPLDGTSAANVWNAVCDAAVQSAVRNKYTNLSSASQCPGQVILGQYAASATGPVFTPQCSANCASDTTDIPTAVQIVPFSNIQFLFWPGSTTTSRTAAATTAAATSPPRLGFTLGSFLASYNANASYSNAVLDALLKTSASGQVLGYRGLAPTNVSLGTLTAASPALLGQLFNGGATLGAIMNAEITALGGAGTSAGGSLQTTESGIPAAYLTAPLASILTLATSQGYGSASAAESAVSVNLLELLNNAAEMAAKGSGPVDLTLVLPLLQASITAITPPVVVAPNLVGVATGTTAQVSVTLSLAAVPTTLSGMNATGTLNALDCSANTATVQVTTSALQVNGTTLPVTGSGPANFTALDGSQTATVAAIGGGFTLAIGALTTVQTGQLLADLNLAVLGADVTPFGLGCPGVGSATPVLVQ